MEIKTFVNNPVPSNCFLIIKDEHVIVVDPGSKDCSELITYIKSKKFIVDYIILTHDHFDHVWGADKLRGEFDAPIVCSGICKNKLSIPQNYFNLLYYEDNTYFKIDNIEFIILDNSSIEWMNEKILFITTPGHSKGSICFSIGRFLFTGDTILKGFKPLILKRHEGSWIEFRNSIKKIFSCYSNDTKVFPGHGDSFLLGEVSHELLDI